MPDQNPCLLFDIDGTLTDSDRIHILALNEILRPYQLNVDHHTYIHTIAGRMNAEFLSELVPALDADAIRLMGEQKEALFRDMAETLEPLEGLLDLLDWAEKSRIPYAAVTNAPRVNADFMLAKLGLAKRFETVVIAETLPHQKPHPLPYLTGLERLGGHATKSVAFEDSRSGITAAAKAGVAVIGLTTSLDPETLKTHGAHLTAPNYTDPTLWHLIRTTTGR